jgi:glycosyltransferase involved in cell wall biosynthesis
MAAADVVPAVRRTRALFLLTSDRMGGAERITCSLAGEAARSGLFDSVDVFILAWSRSGTLDSLEAECGVGLHYTLAASTSRGIVPLIRFLATRRFDFVFSSATHLNGLCSAMRRLGLLRTGRLVARESTPIFDRDFGNRGRLARMLYRLYGAQDLIVCQTERMRESVSQKTGHRFDSKLKVIPNPVCRTETPLAKAPAGIAAIAPGRLCIVWCGRLAAVKSPVKAIEVLRLLHDGGLTRAHLIVVGDGPLRSEMKKRAADAGLEDFVTFTGHQANPAASMARARLGLVTSDVEGFPNVILEMLAAGVPAIVTTDCAGGLDQLPSTLVSPATDPERIAETAIRALAAERTKDVDQYLKQRSPQSVLRSMIDQCPPGS